MAAEGSASRAFAQPGAKLGQTRGVVVARSLAIDVEQVEEMDALGHRLAEPGQLAQGGEDLRLLVVGCGDQHRDLRVDRGHQRFQQPLAAQAHRRRPHDRVGARRGGQRWGDQAGRLESGLGQQRARRVEAQGADRLVSRRQRAGDLGLRIGVGLLEAAQHQIAPAARSSARRSSE